MGSRWIRSPETSVTVATASLKGRRYHIHDRDPLFTTAFLATLAAVE